MTRERKRDALRRRLLAFRDRPSPNPQAYEGSSILSAPGLEIRVPSLLRADTPESTQSTQVESLDTQHRELQTPNDLWAAAFKRFQENDGDLAQAYADHLNPARSGDAAIFDVDFVESTIKNLEDKRGEKQWKVAFAGKSIHVRSQVEKMVKFLLWTDNVVKVAVSSQPYAALAWSAVSIFLPLMNTGTELHDAMLAGLESVNRILVFWKISEGSVFPFRGHSKNDFYDVLIELHCRVIRYYAHAVCHLSCSQLTRAWENLAGWNGWIVETKGINELNHNCQEYIETVQREAFQDTMDKQLVQINNSRIALEDISKSLQDIYVLYEDQVEGKLLESLHADYKGHKNANPRRVSGTCQWLLQDSTFCQWRENGTSSLLWISAGPGYGKSVLARCLIDEKLLQSPGRVSTSSVCYFFFKDGDGKRTKAADAVAAILHQLFSQDLTGKLIRKAKIPFHSAGINLRGSFDTLWEILTSCITSPDSGEIICVLDGLNECEISERARIISYIGNFYNENRNSPSTTSSLKFLITSRTYDDIDSSIRKFCNPAQRAHVNGDEYLGKIREEIKLVINHNLPRVTEGLPKDASDLLANGMAKMENRTYLWLRLFFQIIDRNPSKYKTTRTILHLLESLPSEVSDVYENILQPFNNQPETELLLQLILVTSKWEPLRLQMANEALTLALTNETSQWGSFEDFRNDCWGAEFEGVVQNLTGFLVVIEPGYMDSRLSFLHQTFREFLISPEPSSTPGLWKGRFSSSQPRTTMFSCCMKALSVVNRPCLRFIEGILDNMEPHEYHLPGPSFLGYAVNSWPRHYELQSDDKKDEHYDLVRSLCDITRPESRDWMTYNVQWIHFITETRLSITSLHGPSLAALLGLAYLVEKMIHTEKIDVNQSGDQVVSPLQAASWNGDLGIVRMLIENNANIDDDFTGIGTPVECAIKCGHVDVVKFLLTCKPAPFIREKALELAARSTSEHQLLEVLLQRFPDLEVPETLLEFAAAKGFSGDRLLDLLLRERPAVKLPHNLGLTAARNQTCGLRALHLLLSKRDDLRITEELVEAAVEHHQGSLQVLHLLFEMKPDLTVTNRAMMVAAKNKCDGAAITKFFVEKRQGLEIPEPVFCAAAANDKFGVEILQLLFTEQSTVKISSGMIRGAIRNSRCRDVLNILACREGFNVDQSDVDNWFQLPQAIIRFEHFIYAARLRKAKLEMTAAIMKVVTSWGDEAEKFLEAIGTDFPFVINDDVYNEWEMMASTDQMCLHEGPEQFRNEYYEAMKLLIGAQGCRLQMKGKEGNYLSKEEVLHKLDTWKRRLDFMGRSNGRSISPDGRA